MRKAKIHNKHGHFYAQQLRLDSGDVPSLSLDLFGQIATHVDGIYVAPDIVLRSPRKTKCSQNYKDE